MVLNFDSINLILIGVFLGIRFFLLRFFFRFIFVCLGWIILGCIVFINLGWIILGCIVFIKFIFEEVFLFFVFDFFLGFRRSEILVDFLGEVVVLGVVLGGFIGDCFLEFVLFFVLVIVLEIFIFGVLI